jgi:hypothetical protein
VRHALAETFSSVGIQGEDVWRAAAQVRALLVMNQYGSCLAAVRSPEFWKDPDVRWLTGVHASDEFLEYFDQERFEAFVCWLKMPALISLASESASPTKAANDVTAIAANLAYAAKVSSYELRRFLVRLTAKDERQPRPSEEEPATP